MSYCQPEPELPVGSMCNGVLCLSVCVAIDIDATDLEPEEHELPVNLRSPKASPNTVMSPLAKEKRMAFFKKVNAGLPPTSPDPRHARLCPSCTAQTHPAPILSVLATSTCLSVCLPACPAVLNTCLSLLFRLTTAKQKQKSVS